MIVVLTGAPGAGKGTQADLLAEKCGYRKISTGDALRKHVKQGTEIGKVAGAIMERGQLVPDDVLFQILKEELGDNPQDVILLDGYPRNIHQAETLGSLAAVHPVKSVVHLDVPHDDLVSRLSGRRICSGCGASYHMQQQLPRTEGVCDRCGGTVVQRKDDRPEAVSVRLNVYDRETKPILEFYDRQGLYRKVVGTGSTGEVFDRLKSAIDAP